MMILAFFFVKTKYIEYVWDTNDCLVSHVSGDIGRQNVSISTD